MFDFKEGSPRFMRIGDMKFYRPKSHGSWVNWYLNRGRVSFDELSTRKTAAKFTRRNSWRRVH